MQVNPVNRPALPAEPIHSSTPASSRPESAPANFSGTESLNRALDEQKPARAEEVQRGRELMADLQYPPQELIRRLSRLLAERWDGNPPS
jgi:hypothetical protein